MGMFNGVAGEYAVKIGRNLHVQLRPTRTVTLQLSRARLVFHNPDAK